MKILVPVKVVADPEQRIAVEDGAVTSKGGLIINPFDEYAIEAALRLSEKGPKGERTGTVTVVSLGDPAVVTKPLRNAIAMGCDEALVVEADEESLDARDVAHILKSLVISRGYDLILMGKQSVEGDAGVVPSYLAGLLGWPQGMFAASLEWDGSLLKVTQEWDSGTVAKSFGLPAVVSVDLRIVSPSGVRVPEGSAEYPDGPRYASMKGQLKARKARIPVLSLADLGVAPEGRVSYDSHATTTQERAREIVREPAEFVSRFMEILGGRS